MQKNEQSARKKLDDALAMLDPIIQKMNGTELDFSPKVKKYRNELKKLRERNRQIVKEFKNKSFGTVNSKLEECGKWQQSCQKTLQDIVPHLHNRIKALEGNVQAAMETAVKTNGQEVVTREIQQLLAKNRPAKAPRVDKKIEDGPESIKVLTEYVDFQLQDREKLHLALVKIGTQFEDMTNE